VTLRIAEGYFELVKLFHCNEFKLAIGYKQQILAVLNDAQDIQGIKSIQG
jgi:hypothetical protein